MRKATARCIAFGSSVLVTALPLISQTPEQRAVEYLSAEVPRWAAENNCFSCHNNGDGARALYTAKRLGYQVPPAALADTTRWLTRPAQWEKGRADPAISDKKLARIQFAASLAEAREAGAVADDNPLMTASEVLVNLQSADGSWTIDGDNNVGSPATYGTTLATTLSLATLERSAATRLHSAAIKKAAEWLTRADPSNTLDAAAVFLAIPSRRSELWKRISEAQTSRGGWGPQKYAPPEPFDTAVVLLALQRWQLPQLTAKPIERGRAYLVGTQQPSGGWPETTRPAGSQSYAQHISTSAWATLALLLTNPERE
jgi:hypothetical protein